MSVSFLSLPVLVLLSGLQVWWSALHPVCLYILRYFYPAHGLTQITFRLSLHAKWKWTQFPEEKLDTCFLPTFTLQSPLAAEARIQTCSSSVLAPQTLIDFLLISQSLKYSCVVPAGSSTQQWVYLITSPYQDLYLYHIFQKAITGLSWFFFLWEKQSACVQGSVCA